MVPPLQIGQRYLVPDEDGNEVDGVLEDAIMDEAKKSVMGIYRLQDGRRIMCRCPVSDEELREYRRDPDNFFGVHKPVPKELSNYEDCYNFLYATYQHTPKATLLEFMSKASNIEELKKRSQSALAKIYCEHIAKHMAHGLKKKLN